MEIQCIACQTKNHLIDNQIDASGLMVRCRICNYIFMVYPPDIDGIPIAQDTRIDQSILDELIRMQEESRAKINQNKISLERQGAMVEIGPADRYGKKKSASDSQTEDLEYAELPDLSELESMIDWDDIDDIDDPPATPATNYSDPRGLDADGTRN